MIHRYHWHSNCLKPVLRFVIIGGITSSFLQNTVFTCLSRFAWFWAADSTRFTASCVFASGYPTYGCWQLNVCLHLIELFFFFSPISFRLSECDVRKTDKGQKPFFFQHILTIEFPRSYILIHVGQVTLPFSFLPLPFPLLCHHVNVSRVMHVFH